MILTLLAAALVAQTPAPPAAPVPPVPPRPPRVERMPPPPSPALGTHRLLLGEWPATPSGKRVTLSERKMTVDDALEKIADAADWNLVANTGSAGDRVLVLGMRAVPVEQALQSVLEGTGLAATRRGDTVTVAPAPLAPRAEGPVLSGFDKPTGRKVTADFADTPVDKALRQIADAAGLSLVLPPGLRGAVTAHFKDAPVEDALRAVLGQGGLSAVREGSVLTVSRESGPRVVIRGGRRHLQFEVDTPEEQGPDFSAFHEEMARAKEEMARAKEEMERAKEGGARAAEEALAEVEKRLPRARRVRDRVSFHNITIGPGERVRDVVAIRGNVRLEPGAIAREVTAVLGSVELGAGAHVERNATAVGGDLHVASGARVGRDATSVGGELVIDPGGEVEGEQTSVALPGLKGMLGAAGWSLGLATIHSPFIFAGQLLSQFAMLFALGLILLIFFPRRLDAVAASVEASPGKATLVGLVGTLTQPILLVLLVVTIVGIPLVAVQILALLVAGLLGFSALAMLVGRRIPFRVERGQAVLHLAIGTALVVVLVNLPVVGPLVWVVAWLVVFGAVLRTRFGRPEVPPAAPLETQPPPAPAA